MPFVQHIDKPKAAAFEIDTPGKVLVCLSSLTHRDQFPSPFACLRLSRLAHAGEIRLPSPGYSSCVAQGVSVQFGTAQSDCPISPPREFNTSLSEESSLIGRLFQSGKPVDVFRVNEHALSSNRPPLSVSAVYCLYPVSTKSVHLSVAWAQWMTEASFPTLSAAFLSDGARLRPLGWIDSRHHSTGTGAESYGPVRAGRDTDTLWWLHSTDMARAEPPKRIVLTRWKRCVACMSLHVLP